MVDVPVAKPPASPLAEPIDTTPGLLLLHVPPLYASLKTVVALWHMDVTPEMAAGVWFTVIVLIAVQPVGNV